MGVKNEEGRKRVGKESERQAGGEMSERASEHEEKEAKQLGHEAVVGREQARTATASYLPGPS